MTIPANITTQLTALIASTKSAAPLNKATRSIIGAIQAQAFVLVTSIDTAVTNAAGALDGPDPSGTLAAMSVALTNLTIAAENQSSLVNMRGTVGRAATNLNQITP